MERTDEQIELDMTRAQAAGYARRQRLEGVAQMIEAGKADDAPEMRLAVLMRQDSQHGPEFRAAWAELAADKHASR